MAGWVSGSATSGTAELQAIAVEEEARGSGVSLELAELLSRRAKQEGCCRIQWEVLGRNLRARRYYEKIGGRIVGESRRSGHRVLWFEKDLRS